MNSGSPHARPRIRRRHVVLGAVVAGVTALAGALPVAPVSAATKGKAEPAARAVTVDPFKTVHQRSTLSFAPAAASRATDSALAPIVRDKLTHAKRYRFVSLGTANAIDATACIAG